MFFSIPAVISGEALAPDPDIGRIPPEVLPGRAFAAESISIEVESPSGDTDFPAFTDSIPAPEFPVLTRIGDLKDPDLAAAPSVGIDEYRADSLRVEWEAGDGDYFEFLIIPGAGSETRHMKLRCITFDDGCLEVPVEALRHLALDLATNFQLKVERHNFVLHSVKDGDATRAAALIDASSALEGTVLR